LEREGEPVKLLTQDAAWEGDLVEAPLMWEHAGNYYLFFSANAYYNESYAVGYATCEGPLGPCEDAPENPILKTANGAAGPGHPAIIEDNDGDTWMAYHAWPPDAIGSTIPGRILWLDELTWQNGKPVVEGPTKDQQPVP
jgi:beta-xylosidase